MTSGSRTLKDAISEAMRDWVTNVGDTYYLLGSALGAHPYPMMVRDFQKVIGEEARRQILESEGRLPDAIFACVGGGSERHRHFPCVCGGRARALDRRRGRRTRQRIWASMRRAFAAAHPACCKARDSYLLQDEDGQVSLTHSVSAGLDYAHDRAGACLAARSASRGICCGFRRRGAWMRRGCSRHVEGIIPALESAHAVAEAVRRAPAARGRSFLVNMSGRGDKDIDIYRENFKELDAE